MNRTQLAAHLGVSKGYVSQLLNGDYDHKLSKLVELALAFGYVPAVTFVPVEKAIEADKQDYTRPSWKTYNYANSVNDVQITTNLTGEFSTCKIDPITAA